MKLTLSCKPYLSCARRYLERPGIQFDLIGMEKRLKLNKVCLGCSMRLLCFTCQISFDQGEMLLSKVKVILFVEKVLAALTDCSRFLMSLQK